MSFVKFFDPSKSYLAHKEEFDSEMQRVLTAGDLILRKDLEEFEKNLAQFTGSAYAVGLNSGTDALYLALKALGIGPGDEVITSSYTFVATVQVINQLGARPILVDLGDDWQEKITHRTRAVIPCHIAGEVSLWQPIDNIPMIDDSCQALGAKGLQGKIQCWSFYPAKILGAFGDAGAITTNDEKLANEIREMRHHWKTDYSDWGINSRLDNLQAAVLNVKMKYLPSTLERRKQIAEIYIASLPWAAVPKATEDRVWQDFIIHVSEHRDDLYAFLKSKGVETMKNEYPFPIRKLPKSTHFEESSLRLPINEVITDEEVRYVIDCIRVFYDLYV